MYTVDYLSDIEVDARTDEQLRELLSICFDNQPIFRKQRYFYEKPSHRWVVNSNAKPVAHAALHEKVISINGEDYKVGGVAEVCVHPEYRGKGFVRLILTEITKWMKANHLAFGLLFANHPNVYSPSEYFVIDNCIRYYEPETNQWHEKIFTESMVCLINEAVWPEGLVNLNGPKF